MYTLGINAAFHDSAACLVRDGKVIAAAEEERFTRIKHGKRPIPFSTYELPFYAVEYCLREANIMLKEVEHVAYSFEPFSLLGQHRDAATITLPLEPSAHPRSEQWESVWDPLFLSSIVNAPRHLAGGAPHHLKKRFEGISAGGPYQWHFVPHHLAHAISAFFPAPFEEAAVMTLDGRGEKDTTIYGYGRGYSFGILGRVQMPHSLGMVYERVTEYLGFLHSSDEYKVMALASFGKPRFVDYFREKIQIGEEGNYTVQPLELVERFGPPRQKGDPFDEVHSDIAHSLQVVLEVSVLKISQWLHRATQSKNLCLAGGVALNCVMNARLLKHGPFENIWVQPAAGDAGTALGAALWVDAHQRGLASEDVSRARSAARDYEMDHAYLGPAYEDREIEEFLRWSKLPFRKSENVAADTAEVLAQDKIIGWFQGRMEYGPRALGGRSILASPISPDMQAKLNEIKEREDFRPVAPVVLEEAVHDWFVDARRSPFMLFVYDVKPDKVDQIPAVRHVDNTARIQTVNRQQHPLYYDLLKEFGKRTGVPVLVNTSFNTRGEPVVCSPRDAIECFWSSPLDALIIGSYILEKGA